MIALLCLWPGPPVPAQTLAEPPVPGQTMAPPPASTQALPGPAAASGGSPAAPDPAAPDRTVLNPSAPDSATPDSATPNPATPNPSAPDPSAPDPAAPDSATPNPSAPDPASEQKPSSRPDFLRPGGGQFNLGDEDGFGLGTATTDPTVLEGATRLRTVLPGSVSRSTISLYGHYVQPLGEHDRFLFESRLDPSLVSLDAGCQFALGDGFLGFNLQDSRARSLAYENGTASVGLPPGPAFAPAWVDRLGGGLEYALPFGDSFRMAFGANYQRVSISDRMFGDNLYAFDALGNPITLSPTGRDHLVMLRAAGLYSDLDDPDFPHRGTRLRFGLDKSFGVGSSPVNFHRLAANLTGYLPLGSDPVLVLNLQAGQMGGTVPGYEAFNLGGADSVRGWAAGELGSGTSFLQTSAEFRFPLTRFEILDFDLELRVCAFADYASALGTQSRVVGQPGLVRGKPGQGYGYGLGLQMAGDVGLIRLEYGRGDGGRDQVYLSVGDRF